MRSFYSKLCLVLCVIVFIAFTSPISVFAANSLDDLGGSSSSSADSGQTSTAVGDYLKGYNAVDSDNMAKANTLAGPIANAIGTFAGFVMIVVSAGIFGITALDLAYIGMPFLRPTLNPNYSAGGSAQGGMMGGGMMGGMRGGMHGGMQGGGASGGRVWVSDEAVAAVALATQGAGGGAQGGMGGPGMMGGGMMGGGMQGGAQPVKTKSVIAAYFKKRVFFVIIFAVCSVVLMSSVLTDCGINLAGLFMKVMNLVNGNISNVQI